MAYNCNDGHRSCWFRHQRDHTQRRRTLHLLLPLRVRRVLSQLCHLGLGVRHARSNSREEGGVAFHRQCCVDGQFHLHAVPVSKGRWAKVCHCDEQQCVILGCMYCCSLGTENLAADDEPEDETRGGKRVLCLLSCDAALVGIHA